MFKKVFLLLLTWPLLLPPGVCLCRLGTLGVLTPVAAEAQAETPPQVAPPRCSCCRHKAACSTGCDSKTVVGEGTTSDSSPDTPHSPSCPAHPSWVVARAVVSGPALTLDPGDFLVLWVTLDPASLTFQPHSSRSCVPDERPDSTVPIYLSCCDLRC